MANEQFLDDFSVGQRFSSARLVIDLEAIRRFAEEYDPQPFHLDEQAARETLFRGLAASGWHTAALTHKLLVASEFKPAGGIIGASIDLQFPRPTRPGDELHVETEVLEVKPSKSRPEQGILRVRVTTLNQDREVVMTYLGNLVVRCRLA